MDALNGALASVAEVLGGIQEHGQEIPVPIADRPYPGGFMVRITPEAHRRLAIDVAGHETTGSSARP